MKILYSGKLTCSICGSFEEGVKYDKDSNLWYCMDCLDDLLESQEEEYFNNLDDEREDYQKLARSQN